MQFKQKSLKTYSGVTSTLLQRQYKHNLKRKQQIIYVDYTQVTHKTFSDANLKYSFLLQK